MASQWGATTGKSREKDGEYQLYIKIPGDYKIFRVAVERSDTTMKDGGEAKKKSLIEWKGHYKIRKSKPKKA